MEIIRLKYDISAASEMLHRAHIVHADIHADNVMLRTDPACLVLIDYAGCTGDSVYPLHLGYGASGYGGVTHRPPTLESSPDPVRTAYGDYYRLARTIMKQLYIGPEPSKRKHTDKDTALPTHFWAKNYPHGLTGTTWPRPPSPASPFPLRLMAGLRDLPYHHLARPALEGQRGGPGRYGLLFLRHRPPSLATPTATSCLKVLLVTVNRAREVGRNPLFQRDSF